VLLHEESGDREVVVGTDIANRHRTEIEQLIGFFINQLPLRISLEGNPSFGQLVERVRDVCLAAYAHQDLPFDRMVELLGLKRTLAHSPVFQVKLFVQNAPLEPLRLPGLEISRLAVERGAANLDLTLALWESAHGLRGWLNYRTDLFDRSTVRRLLRGYERVLEWVTEAPQTSVEELCTALSNAAKKEQEMRKKSRRGLDLEKFKKAKPQVVELASDELVEMEPMFADRKLPLLVRPLKEDVDLAEWARASRSMLQDKLFEHGAIVFRGFDVRTTEVFERFAASVCDELFHENGEHPRENLSGKVYTPVFYPPDQQLLWHNENSFNFRWPEKIIFCCVKAPEEGGETPIVDSREVYERIDPAIRKAFAERQVMYMRNYSQGLGLDWRSVFQTSDPAELEQRAAEQRFDLDLREDGSVQTRAVRPAVIEHRATGQHSWFNQAQHWHVSCLDSETRSSLQAVFKEEDFPRNCYFGDGEPIDDAMMDHILDVYRQLEVSFQWQEGDVMVLDNVLTAHGRNPFVGERKILVAMGDMATFGES